MFYKSEWDNDDCDPIDYRDMFFKLKTKKTEEDFIEQMEIDGMTPEEIKGVMNEMEEEFDLYLHSNSNLNEYYMVER